MTKWSKPDNEGVTRRKVGKHRLRADINGWWAVLTEEMNGAATDLVSAQAAADAAVEKLLRQADADFGLRFGPWNRLESSTPTRHAVAADGWPYIVARMDDGRWFFGPASGDTGVRATESAAIAAAREHDAARRGGK